MGISSNQARFLALTSRQVDLEFRVQQICQRRLRLSSELENVATSYNNKISNRQLYSMNTNNSGISKLSISGINNLLDTNGNKYKVVGTMQKPSANYAITDGVTWAAATGLVLSKHDISGTTSIDNATLSLQSLGLPAGATEEQALDAAFRSGLLTLATQKDEFTQSTISVGNSTDATLVEYEAQDWRTIPALADELYKGDDVTAENKYDKTIAEINAQDKKLQLEQTSIEVEYKAVTSEKESVKKILDTNATASFKYFS